jgi:hypothetical protein
MIKTLRITSVLVAMGAIALMGMSVVFGIERDSEVQALVKSEGPVAQFEQNQGKAAANKSANTKHPLVVAAEQYALLLNPPITKRPLKSPRKPTNSKTPVVAQNISGSTNLVALCYNAQDPNFSFALVDVPGKGQRWVGINDKIDHHVVHEILADKVILMNGNQRQTKTIEKKAIVSLIKGENQGAASAAGASVIGGTTKPLPGNRQISSRAKRPIGRPTTRNSALRSTHTMTPEERAKALSKALTQAQEMQVDVSGMSESQQKDERIRREKIVAAIIAAKNQAQSESPNAGQLRELGKDFIDRQNSSGANDK